MTGTLPSDPDIYVSNRLYSTVTCQVFNAREVLLSNVFLRVSHPVSQSFKDDCDCGKIRRAMFRGPRVNILADPNF